MPEKSPRFTLLADGCFCDEDRLYRDENGGWYKYEYTPTLNPDKRVPLKECRKLAAECTLAGGGWNLTSPGEMFALVDQQKVNPATDAPGIVSGWHWTDQVDVASPSGCAWNVDLRYGGVLWSLQDGFGFAVACRRVSASECLDAVGLRELLQAKCEARRQIRF